MADRFYGASQSAQMPNQVTEAGSTTGAVVELRINDAIWANPLHAQLALEAIRSYLRTKETRPIA